MAKLLQYCLLHVLAVILFCMGGALTSSNAAENAPLLTNGEEYAVFAAVLFPMEQTSVYLEKSSLTGTWKIINFELNRRY